MSEKGITQQEFDALQEAANTLESAFNDFDTALRNAAPHMHERWKVYGKYVSSDYVIGGPNMQEVMEALEQDIIPDDVEDDDNSEEDLPCHTDCIYPEKDCTGCDQIKSVV